jgi:pimeloyl-ACP methyl ester carboxylesterase
VISATDDPISPPRHQQVLAEGLPDATIASYRSGHLVMVARAGEVAAHIEAILDGKR